MTKPETKTGKRFYPNLEAVGAASQRWWLSFKDGRRLEKDGKIPVQRKEGIF